MSKLRLLIGLLAVVAVGAFISPWALARGARPPRDGVVQEAERRGGSKVLAGPIDAQVTRVLDGDTFEVLARTWIEEDRRMLVRITGINAPELHTRCPEERKAAEASQQELTRLVGGVGAWVSLRDIRNDKYGGRVRARVAAHGVDVAEAMLRGGFAVPYHGGHRDSYCGR